MIWGALLIPFLAALAMAYWGRRRVTWWELVIPFVAASLLIGIAKVSSETLQTLDQEYWGGWAVTATYYEPWDEEVPCSHAKYRTETRTRSVSDGKGGTTTETYSEQVFDGYEHAYDVDYHGPIWEVINSNGEHIGISQGYWQHLTEFWSNRSFRELNRDYHSVDGNAYDTVFPGTEALLVPTKTPHVYENRVQASSSVFNYPEVSKTDRKRYGLYAYPRFDPLYGPAVLPTGRHTGEPELQRTNALLGRSKQVCVWVLIFKDQPLAAALKQEALWKRGNKNEFVVCVSLDAAEQVQWAQVFSWTKEEQLKVEARNFLLAQPKLDLVAFDRWLRPELEQHWKRRPFKEFSYLTVEPPAWVIWLVYGLVLCLTGGLSWWALVNEFGADGISRGLRSPGFPFNGYGPSLNHKRRR